MALNAQEKAAIRYHLGYPQLQVAASIFLGVPDVSQLAFILETNMDNVLPDAELYIRRCLQELGCIEDQMSKMRGSVEIRRVTGAVEFRTGDAFLDMDDRYREWVSKLSDILGSPPSVFSNNNARLAMAGGISTAGVIEPS